MDNAMADIQADDMKHGLYDEPKRANLDEALTDWIAFAEEQEELRQTARDLGIEL